ncbi:hypothetical protein [Thauera phenylacetica]|jgi:hypothetical protein
MDMVVSSSGAMRRERGCRKVKQDRVVRLLGGARLAITGYRVCT